MKEKLKDSLGPKLVMIIVGGLIVLNGLTTWYNLYVQDKGVIKLLEMSGAQLSSTIAGAAKDGMLRNDREAIQRTVETLGSQYEISTIRIANSDGSIAYSSKKEEIGKKMEASEKSAQGVKELDSEKAGTHPRVLELLTPIKNQPECYNAACHAHKASDNILGYLQIHSRLDPFDQIKRNSAFKLAIASFLGILFTAIVAFFAVHKLVHKPVKELMSGVKEVANGNLSTRVPELSRDELGQLAKSFNRMSQELHKAHIELVDWAQTLEFRVSQKTEELERAQSQMLQIEKMASLGRLAAIVAHEINNPLASVVTYAKLILKKLKNQEEISESCKDNMRYLEAIISEAQRCGDIVSQLLSFSRQSKEEFEKSNLLQIAEKAVFLLHHKMELSQVKVEVEKSEDLPFVDGDRSQLQQALMALLINACEAMEKGGGGLVRIYFGRADNSIRMTIEDNGPGMEPEVAHKVFEPFFSTKANASAVGLGLSVVYSIVMRHNGKIRLETAPQKGAKFIIDLPISAEEAKK
jgi:two-component system, NtrC family, sensor kinase